ncbi:MAG: hypothetical protein ACI9WU_004936, partial [Myxococcota bacterium]
MLSQLTRWGACLAVCLTICGMGVATGCAAEDEAVDPAADGQPIGDGKFDSAQGGGIPSIYAIGNRLDPWNGRDTYLDQVQPIVARQCVTCHGCGDAPCQLKMTSFEGMMRGSNEDDLYAPRLLSIDREYDPMHMSYGRRLNEDGTINYAATEEEWRDLDFYSVINRQTQSVMARLLTEAHDVTTHLDQSFEVAKSIAGRSFECVGSDNPKAKEMIGRAMPLGLPPLADEDKNVLLDWMHSGSGGLSADAQLAIAVPRDRDAIAEWEDFFNPPLDDARSQLVSRYLYEHLFFAHLHFERNEGEFYRLVRSRTRTGPIDEIVMERPFDVPKKTDIFYRFEKLTEVLVAKSHVVWNLAPETMTRWDELFHQAEWTMDNSRIFDPSSDNPFAYFAAIPAKIRSRFMMENSKQLVDAMVRGSVCTGAGATFAIRDRFWVWFMDVESDVTTQEAIGGTFTGGPFLGESSWFHLNPESSSVFRERDYLGAHQKWLQRYRPDGLSISDIWDGDGGTNPNAWLTILRHDKSATVHHGAIGGQPETMWILTYANFERLYYNLVVQFKVWSHAAHKLDTWTLMAYVRSEGEDIAAALLEPAMRDELRVHETRGWGTINSFLFPSFGECSRDRKKNLGKGCEYPTRVSFPAPTGANSTERLDHAMGHLAGLVAEHIGVSLDEPLNAAGAGSIPSSVSSVDELEEALSALTGWKSDAWQFLPELTLIR